MIYLIALASFVVNGTAFHGSPIPRCESVDGVQHCADEVDTQGINAVASIDTVELVSFAQTLVGIPYKYASADPVQGFDCSGFVSYVFKHFAVNVPRSSSAFSKIGTPVSLEEARAGDIVLFTSPKSTERKVGHVGIVTEGGATLSFIHASSGKAYSVTESTMTAHYKKRFIKVIRVLT